MICNIVNMYFVCSNKNKNKQTNYILWPKLQNIPKSEKLDFEPCIDFFDHLYSDGSQICTANSDLIFQLQIHLSKFPTWSLTPLLSSYGVSSETLALKQSYYYVTFWRYKWVLDIKDPQILSP